MRNLSENLSAARLLEQFGSFDNVLLEMTAEEAEAIKPKDGKWEGKVYYFNVEGDDGSDCWRSDKPLYSVTFGIGGQSITTPVTIAFFRCGGTKDVDKGFQKPVFDGVQKAIYEYIKKYKPLSLSWHPVGKSKSFDPNAKIKNPEARKFVYDALTKRSLFPDRYVSLYENNWIRRDLYDKYLVPEGFPPITLTNQSNLKEKNTELENLRSIFKQNPDLYLKLYKAERKYREDLETKYQEKLASAFSDSKKNPQNLQIGDKVEYKIDNESESDNYSRFMVDKKAKKWYENSNAIYVPNMIDSDKKIKYKYGIIEGKSSLQDENGNRSSEEDSFLIVSIKFFKYYTDHISNYDQQYFPIADLYKIDFEEKKQEEIKEINDEILDPQNNPKQIKIGDKVILGNLNNPPLYDSPNYRYNNFGIVAKVKDIKRKRLFGQFAYIAEVESIQDESLTEKAKSRYNGFIIDINLKEDEINFYNDENVKKVKEHDRRQTDLQTVASQRRRFERASKRDEEMRRIQSAATTPEMQQLIDDPENPEKIKPGDRIKIKTNEEGSQEGIGWIHSRFAGRDAIVTTLERNWLGSIQVYFKVVRSTIESNLKINYVKKVVDETVLARQSRAAARAEVRQRISSGEATGGRSIGDRTTVVSGSHRGKSGIITGWRQTGQYIYAKIRTFESEGHPEEEIQINITNLSPVTSQGVSENAKRFIRLLSFYESLQYRRRKS